MNQSREIYAVCEFSQTKVQLMVTTYHQSQLMVLFNKQHSFIAPEKSQAKPTAAVYAKALQALLKEANSLLRLNIERVAINLPSPQLTIKQTAAVIDLHTTGRLIVEEDIDQVLKVVADNYSTPEETVIFTRPFKYIINHNEKTAKPPVGLAAKSLGVEAFLYVVNQTIVNQYQAILKQAKVKLLSFLPKAFAYAWDALSLADLNKGAVVINLDSDYTSVNVFARQTLCRTVTLAEGINSMINRLATKLNSSFYVASKYFLQIININSNFFDQKVVYSTYDPQTKNYRRFLIAGLRQNIIDDLSTLLNQINVALQQLLGHDSQLPVIFVGAGLAVQGWGEFIKAQPRWAQAHLHFPAQIGALHATSASFLGNAYYQHVMNRHALHKLCSVPYVASLAQTQDQSSALPKKDSLWNQRTQSHQPVLSKY